MVREYKSIVRAFTQGAKDSRGCWGDLQVTPALVNLYEEVNGQTVKKFAWEDYLSDWKKVTDMETAEGHTKYRKVFFIRDKFVNGKGKSILRLRRQLIRNWPNCPQKFRLFICRKVMRLV